MLLSNSPAVSYSYPLSIESSRKSKCSFSASEPVHITLPKIMRIKHVHIEWLEFLKILLFHSFHMCQHTAATINNPLSRVLQSIYILSHMLSRTDMPRPRLKTEAHFAQSTFVYSHVKRMCLSDSVFFIEHKCWDMTSTEPVTLATPKLLFWDQPKEHSNLFWAFSTPNSSSGHPYHWCGNMWIVLKRDQCLPHAISLYHQVF